MLKISARKNDGLTIVDIDGEVKGGPESDRLHTLVREHLDSGQKKILLNLSKVPWINSFGLGIILACLATCRRSEADLRLCGSNQRVSMILGISGVVPAVIQTYADEATAIQAFASPS